MFLTSGIFHWRKEKNFITLGKLEQASCFFQKHITGKIPSSFSTFSVQEDKGQGIYFSIDSANGLRELVQLNAFEIHAWNCRKNNLMRPDQIVMDFDPGPDVAWKEVVSAAKELKIMLEKIGLKKFCEAHRRKRSARACSA